MLEYRKMSAPNRVARVVGIANEGCRLLLELPNRNIVTVDRDSPFDLERGVVLLVREDDNYLELVSDDCWPNSSWVGIVKKKLPDGTIIDANGILRFVSQISVDAHEEGNTVLCDDLHGIVEVLCKDPVQRFEQADPDASAVAGFRIEKDELKTTFEDFGGFPDVVRLAQELVSAATESQQALAEMGVKQIRGAIFTGPPGTGKTLLARIIAKCADAAFYQIRGPEIFSKWYGQSPKLLRMIFDDAAKQEHAIVFFDEIDSIAGRRAESAHEESRRVVAQLLTLMDGFDTSSRVVVIAATNRRHDIDPALLRPGRFDLEIPFRSPSLSDRAAVLRASSKHLPLLQVPFPIEEIADKTEGWSCAELAAIWRDAGFLAERDQRRVIIPEDLIWGHARIHQPRKRLKPNDSQGLVR